MITRPLASFAELTDLQEWLYLKPMHRVEMKSGLRLCFTDYALGQGWALYDPQHPAEDLCFFRTWPEVEAYLEKTS